MLYLHYSCSLVIAYMNIVFFTSLDPNDINIWSGTTWHILKALQKYHNVTIIGTNMLLQTSYFTSNNFPKDIGYTDYSSVFGDICSDRINSVANCDLVFFGDLHLSPCLDVNMPIVHVSDTNYHLFKEYSSSKNCVEQIRRIEEKERLVLNKYSCIIYSSEWARQDSISYYNIDPGKIHVVEFGANIPHVKDFTIDINCEVCNLVFIGKNWERKGGEKVLEAYRILKSEGFPCTLTIIGSAPNTQFDDKLRVFPFLDKSQPEHLEKLSAILKNSHFLVLPTEFESYGIVFCEASAYAVPSIAANIGGVSQPIREDANGYLMAPDANAVDYANKIKSIFHDKELYRKLRISSRHEYETRLNWDIWICKVNEILEETKKKFSLPHE